MSSMPPAHSDLPPPSDRHDWLPSRRGLLLTALRQERFDLMAQ